MKKLLLTLTLFTPFLSRAEGLDEKINKWFRFTIPKLSETDTFTLADYQAALNPLLSLPARQNFGISENFCFRNIRCN